jgi:hypothetical protein
MKCAFAAEYFLSALYMIDHSENYRRKEQYKTDKTPSAIIVSASGTAKEKASVSSPGSSPVFYCSMNITKLRQHSYKWKKNKTGYPEPPVGKYIFHLYSDPF